MLRSGWSVANGGDGGELVLVRSIFRFWRPVQADAGWRKQIGRVHVYLLWDLGLKSATPCVPSTKGLRYGEPRPDHSGHGTAEGARRVAIGELFDEPIKGFAARSDRRRTPTSVEAKLSPSANEC